MICLTGCLDAPPALVQPPGASPDGGGEDDDSGVAHPVGCTPGSQLELAYVSELAVPDSGMLNLRWSGVAVVINPGPEPILVVGTGTGGGTANGVDASFELTAGDAVFPVGPGEAHGDLSDNAKSVVNFAEPWVDQSSPRLNAQIQVDGDVLDYEDAQVNIPLDIGGYQFALTLRVFSDWEREDATPVASARATATCD